MFDVIGIDWGQKTFGLAFGSLSTGLVIISQKTHYSKDIWVDLELELKNRKISKVVIGLPLNFRLESVANTLKVQKFADELKNRFEDVQVFLVNERGSTSADRGDKLVKVGKGGLKVKQKKGGVGELVLGGNKGDVLVHNLSAKKILEWWLERQS